MKNLAQAQKACFVCSSLQAEMLLNSKQQHPKTIFEKLHNIASNRLLEETRNIVCGSLRNTRLIKKRNFFDSLQSAQ